MRWLQIQRKAAFALNQLCNEMQLGSMALRFNGDDCAAWAVHGEHYAVALNRGRRAAEVIIEGSTVTIVIEDIYRIIRGQHVSKFDPAEFGIRRNASTNIYGDKEPDIVATWELEQEIPGLELRHRPVPKVPRVRPVKVLR